MFFFMHFAPERLLLWWNAIFWPHCLAPSLRSTDDLPNYCSGAGKQKYYKFNIANWQSAGHADYRDRGMTEQVAHIDRMLSWVDSALGEGGSVLIHCLAGAHRAGTTGILCLMHKGGLGAEAATAAAKAARCCKRTSNR